MELKETIVTDEEKREKHRAYMKAYRANMSEEQKGKKRASDRKYAARRRDMFRDEVAAYMRTYRQTYKANMTEEQRSKRRARDREYKASLPTAVKTRERNRLREWKANNNAKTNEHKRTYYCKHRDAIAKHAADYLRTYPESIVRRYLADTTFIPKDQIPQELIEVKRLQLLIQRRIKDENSK